MTTDPDPVVVSLDQLATDDEPTAPVASPAVADELEVGGSTPDPSSDDDVDMIGKAYGVEYPDTQPLDISKKIKI